MQHRSVVRVSENRVLAKIFVPESEEMMGGWGKPRNKELNGL